MHQRRVRSNWIKSDVNQQSTFYFWIASFSFIRSQNRSPTWIIIMKRKFITISQRFHRNTRPSAKRLSIDRHCLRIEMVRDLPSALTVAAKVISKVRPFSRCVRLVFQIAVTSARCAGVTQTINITRQRLCIGRCSGDVSRVHALIRPWLFNTPGNVAGRGTKVCWVHATWLYWFTWFMPANSLSPLSSLACDHVKKKENKQKRSSQLDRYTCSSWIIYISARFFIYTTELSCLNIFTSNRRSNI